jgi:DNA-binding response OmpR family regulator
MIATAASASAIDRIPRSWIAAVLAKPFDVDELVATAHELLRRERRARSIRVVRMAPERLGLRPFRRTRMPFD